MEEILSRTIRYCRGGECTPTKEVWSVPGGISAGVSRVRSHVSERTGERFKWTFLQRHGDQGPNLLLVSIENSLIQVTNGGIEQGELSGKEGGKVYMMVHLCLYSVSSKHYGLSLVPQSEGGEWIIFRWRISSVSHAKMLKPMDLGSSLMKGRVCCGTRCL